MTDRVRAADVPIRPAATVMLLRDGTDGLEVFMLQRTLSASFARGSYVFPGGRVDDTDGADGDYEAVCDGLNDATASKQLGVAHGGLAWYVAAIRECFEEAGVLLARTDVRSDEAGPDGAGPDGTRLDDGAGDSGAVVRFDEPGIVERFNAARDLVHDGKLSLVDLCRTEGLYLLPSTMHFVAHWVTPLGENRRFDTRFFVARAPEAQVPLHDDHETVASLWVRPGDALAMQAAGELLMLPPTVECLRMLNSSATVDEAISAAASVGLPPTILPKLCLSPDEEVIGVVTPGDPDYDTKQDPEFVIRNPR